MKKGAKTGIVVAVILVLFLCCCIATGTGWLFMFGPLSYQTTEANSLIKSANANYKNVKTASKDLEEQLAYLDIGDEIDEQAISQMEEELLKAESKTQEMIDELADADKKLADAKKLRLPDWYMEYVGLLVKRDTAASEGLTALMNGLSETRKLVGSQSYVIDAVNRQSAAWNQVESAVSLMTAGDFAGAQAELSAADASLVATDTALNTANETMKSQDIEDIISFNATCREFLTLLSKFLSAAQAGDINLMTSLETEITNKYSEIEAESNVLGLNNDYASWFESVIKKYEDEYDERMKEAEDQDNKAKVLYGKST